MPTKLTKEQLNQIKYVSLEDYSHRVDELETIEEKLEFTTSYILSHGKEPNVAMNESIDKIIKLGHRKIAEASAKEKEFYHETDVNRGIAEKMVDPTVDSLDKDLAAEMFIANPVGYLKGKAQDLYQESKNKDYKSENDVQNMLNAKRLADEVFTDPFAKNINDARKNPTAEDMNSRLQAAYGGEKGFKKGIEDTKPTFWARAFGKRSVAGRNLDDAFKAFNNPTHAYHGDLSTIKTAAAQYLEHVFPNYKADGYRNLPTAEEIASLKGTRKARALLSLNILNAAKQQEAMEADYKDMLNYCGEKKLEYKDLPEVKEAHAAEEQKQNNFQNNLKDGLIEDEPENENEIEKQENELDKQIEEQTAALE